jgi:hypothetical protein
MKLEAAIKKIENRAKVVDRKLILHKMTTTIMVRSKSMLGLSIPFNYSRFGPIVMEPSVLLIQFGTV